jgi:L-rhamnose mutarotase
MTTRRCHILDLVDDPAAIAAYEDWHRPGRTPASIIEALRKNGVEAMEIYRAGDRLVMIVETADSISDEERESADAANPDVVRWVARMAEFQKPIGDASGWRDTDCIFRLSSHST